MKAIELYQTGTSGQTALGLRFHRKDISLAELLQAWQPLCDAEDIHKMYGFNNHAPCKGCLNNCCSTAYVIPDLIAFKQTARHYCLDYPDFIERFFQAEKVAAGILRMRPEPCIFLQDNVCSIYSIRSLICRFYICSSLSGHTEQFIYSLAWMGSAATQVFAQESGLLDGSSDSGLTSFDLMFRQLIEEYRNKPELKLFLRAESYDDIPLEPFLRQSGF